MNPIVKLNMFLDYHEHDGSVVPYTYHPDVVPHGPTNVYRPTKRPTLRSPICVSPQWLLKISLPSSAVFDPRNRYSELLSHRPPGMTSF